MGWSAAGLGVALAMACSDDGAGTGDGVTAGTGTTTVGEASEGSSQTAGTAGSADGTETDDEPPPAGEPCGTFSPGDAFTVCTATYLGGPGDDAAGGVAIADDGTIWYAGSRSGDELGTTPTVLMGGGDGVVLHLSSDGRELLSLTRIGGHVSDVVVVPGSDAIAVTGDFGVAVLEDGATTLAWSAQPGGNATRVAAAAGGGVAVVHDQSLALYDAAGQLSADVPVGGSAVNDVIAHDGLAIVTGFKQDDGPPCTQLQIPFVRAHAWDGQLAWTAYDWNKDEVGAVDECADSRGMALAIGGDGKLYYAGESHGGNSVHRRLPNDLSQMAEVVKTDMYNDPYDLNGAAPITFYGRMDPATGALEVGQFLVTRLSDGKGNAARPRAIAADAAGNVFVAGATACCIENGTAKTVNGEPAMPEAYQGGGFVLVVSSDFSQRLSWTTFRGETGNGETGVSLAAGANVAVAFHQALEDATTSEQPLLTFDAIQAEAGGGASDGWLAVWPTP
jgi:hypothetical protein